MIHQQKNQIGIVVPTLGNRMEYLILCLESLRKAGCEKITVIVPRGPDLKELIPKNLYDEVLIDPLLGLPYAINMAIDNFDESVKFVGWLGDDDLIEKNSLDLVMNAFNSHPMAVAVIGKCKLIDSEGNLIQTLKFGKFGIRFSNLLPNLIPQPGSLIRRDAFDQIGQLSNRYPLAFDFEMFNKLKKIGLIFYLDETISSFRRHSSSLSVSHRRAAINEASSIRREHQPRFLAKFSFLWEWLVKLVTFYAGFAIDLKVKFSKIKL